MKNNTTLAAGAALLVAGIIAAYLAAKSPGSGGTATADGKPASGSPGTAQNPTPGDNPALTGNPTGRARTRDDTKHKELVAQFGESRTKLAATISNTVIGVLTDAAEIGEKSLSGETGGPFGSRSGLRMALGRLENDLKLTEEQQVKATAAYQAFQRRELDRSKAAIELLKTNPTSLMRLMLAGDATSRGEMSDEDYQQLQSTSAQDLKGVLNPLDEKNFHGGKALRDEAFLSEFKGLLDPGQSQLLEAEQAKRSAGAAPDPNAGNISNIPKMDLEKMDQTINSVRKMTIGFKSMIEGMGGLQELQPPASPATPQQVPPHAP